MELADKYVPAKLNPALLATVKGELAKKELQQRRHYFMLKELQKMATELPGKYRMRLHYDLLSSLASALLDGTVFAIVNELREVQQLEEKNLLAQRTVMINEQKIQKEEMQTKHTDMLRSCQSRSHQQPLVQKQIQQETEAFDKRCREDLHKKDMRIVLDLDQKASEQQSTLEKAGVPEFFVTNKEEDIRLQMYLLDFISRLSGMDIPNS